jgi:hypothetical protein
MKQVILAIAVGAALVSAARAQSPEDTAAIKAAALDYIESWYEGNPERMQRALHPDLAKRIVRRSANGESQLDHMTADKLVDGVRKGGGKNTPPEKQQKEVTVLDVFENAAAVKVVASGWVDYMQMAKWNGRWVIINVLWELKPKGAPQPAPVG